MVVSKTTPGHPRDWVEMTQELSVGVDCVGGVAAPALLQPEVLLREVPSNESSGFCV